MTQIPCLHPRLLLELAKQSAIERDREDRLAEVIGTLYHEAGMELVRRFVAGIARN